MGKKNVRGKKVSSKEKVAGEKISYDGLCPIWVFDRIDRDGRFAFNVLRSDFDSKDVLGKIISYSCMSWYDICKQTHDDGKSKHHFLDFSGMCNDVKERIKKLQLEEYTDIIFSFAFTNKVRVVGIREKEKFHVIWYDPFHEIYPVKK
jgi:hypothetical protein